MPNSLAANPRNNKRLISPDWRCHIPGRPANCGKSRRGPGQHHTTPHYIPHPALACSQALGHQYCKYGVKPTARHDLRSETSSKLSHKQRKSQLQTVKNLQYHQIVFQNGCQMRSSVQRRSDYKSQFPHVVRHKNHPHIHNRPDTDLVFYVMAYLARDYLVFTLVISWISLDKQWAGESRPASRTVAQALPPSHPASCAVAQAPLLQPQPGVQASMLHRHQSQPGLRYAS